MPFFHDQSREQLRRYYFTAWRKHRERAPMEPVEAQIADVIAEHPEYHDLFDSEAELEREYTPEQGISNPFLHLGLHLAVREQVATDRPAGIRAAFTTLAQQLGSTLEAEHQMIECLAETIWTAQRSGTSPNEADYLQQVQRLVRRR